MDTKRLYVDFHILQTVPPSCVNRDDTGSPKTAVYGGAVRARVSSQAWKHAMREMFRNELLAREDVGVRTKKVVNLVKECIEKRWPDKDAEKLANEVLTAAKLLKGTDKELNTLTFISLAQAEALAELAGQEEIDKKARPKEANEALKKNPAADMVLFGRMVADDPSLNYDAAAQVAHSISTHAVQNEYDYFTALDDCQAEDTAGAAHLSTVEYNSSTLYRYATVNVMELNKFLGKEKTVEAICAFAEAMIRSMPTGKQNTFANRTLPDAVYVTIRNDQPVNLCGAFEKPIKKSAEGYATPSKAAMEQYAQTVYASFADEPMQSFVVGTGLEQLGETMPLRKMLSELKTAVEKNLD